MRNYITTFFIAACLVLPAALHAQNMVHNGNFEEYTTCPTNIGQSERAKGWRSYDGATPDYFNTCGNVSTGVPGNELGVQSAASGNGYAGVFTFMGFRPNWEYIAGTMEPLIVGRRYTVSVSVSLADLCRVATSNTGIWFYDKGTDTTLYKASGIPGNAQVKFTDMVTDSIRWTRLSATFIADSAYRNIVIGGFGANPDSVVMRPDIKTSGSYYYIDSVVVEEETLGIGNTGTQSRMHIYPNPVVNELMIDGMHTGTDIRIIDMMGRILIDTTATATTQRINTSALPVGTYILQLRYDGELVNHRFLKE